MIDKIEKDLKKNFRCIMPTTPKDDLFNDYSDTRKNNFMNNLASFIDDAKKAIEEPNHHKASILWRKHLGNRFPIGDDKNDINSNIFNNTIGKSKPYHNGFKQ